MWSGENGFAITASQQELTETKLLELKNSPNFTKTLLLDGSSPKEGELMKLPALAHTLRRPGKDGAHTFYNGAITREVTADLQRCGSPVTAEDLAAQKAQRREPLSTRV